MDHSDRSELTGFACRHDDGTLKPNHFGARRALYCPDCQFQHMEPGCLFRAQGDPTAFGKQPPKPQTERPHPNHYTEEQCIRVVVDLWQELGRSPKTADFNGSTPRMNTIFLQLTGRKSLTATLAVVAEYMDDAGIEYAAAPAELTDEELLDELADLWRKLKMPPSWREAGGARGHKYADRFDSFTRARELAGERLTEEERAAFVLRCRWCGKTGYASRAGLSTHERGCREREEAQG